MSDSVNKLRRLNDALLTSGHDYSDVLLDAALEIERLRANDRRYRWLRDAYASGGVHARILQSSPTEWDGMIDADIPEDFK